MYVPDFLFFFDSSFIILYLKSDSVSSPIQYLKLAPSVLIFILSFSSPTSGFGIQTGKIGLLEQ